MKHTSPCYNNSLTFPSLPRRLMYFQERNYPKSGPRHVTCYLLYVISVNTMGKRLLSTPKFNSHDYSSGFVSRLLQRWMRLSVSDNTENYSVLKLLYFRHSSRNIEQHNLSSALCVTVKHTLKIA